MLLTFLFLMFAWVFFRAATISDALVVLRQGTHGFGQTVGTLARQRYYYLVIALFLVLEYLWRKKAQVHRLLQATGTQWRMAAVSYYSLLFWVDCGLGRSLTRKALFTFNFSLCRFTISCCLYASSSFWEMP